MRVEPSQAQNSARRQITASSPVSPLTLPPSFSTHPCALFHAITRYLTSAWHDTLPGLFHVSRDVHREVDCDLRLANNVGIMCENRPEWVITDLACARYGLVSVPLQTDGTFRWVLVGVSLNSMSQWKQLARCQARYRPRVNI